MVRNEDIPLCSRSRKMIHFNHTIGVWEFVFTFACLLESRLLQIFSFASDIDGHYSSLSATLVYTGTIAAVVFFLVWLFEIWYEAALWADGLVLHSPPLVLDSSCQRPWLSRPLRPTQTSHRMPKTVVCILVVTAIPLVRPILCLCQGINFVNHLNGLD